MKKNWIPYCFIFMMLTCTSCQDQLAKKEVNIINDTFMEMVGTYAYKELSIRPPAPVERDIWFSKLNKVRAFGIVVPDTLFPLNKWKGSLMPYCKGDFLYSKLNMEGLSDALCEVIEKGGGYTRFNRGMIKNIGRYKLISESESNSFSGPVVGKITFSKVVVNPAQNGALLIAVFSDGFGRFVELFFVLEKRNKTWRVTFEDSFAKS